MRFVLLFLIWITLVTGCAKPDNVKLFRSPKGDIYFSIETYNGNGPLSSDFTRVYANLDKNGKHDRKLALDGEYLVITKIKWLAAAVVIVCMQAGGRTNSFSNEVTLRIDDEFAENIHIYLQESCD